MIPFADLKRVGRLDRRIMTEAVGEVCRSGYFVGGPIVEHFEEEFAAYLGVRHVVGVGNGLDALRMTLQAWGIGEGDEVIVPGFTYFATWLAVYQTGATIVPVDVRLEDATIDADQIEAAITPRTRVVIPVHLYGNPCEMPKITNIAKRQGIRVLEDAAQAHGAMLAGKKIGSLGDAAAFSFYPTKNLGAMGDGGAVATNSDEVAHTLRSLRNYGTGKDKYSFDRVGANSRLDPIQAAYLRRRLPKLDGENIQRQQAAKRYKEALGVSDLNLIGPTQLEESVWHVFSVLTTNRSNLVESLRQQGVATDSHYPYCILDADVLSRRREIRSFKSWSNSNSVRLAKGVVSIPLGRWVSNRHRRQILRALKSIGRI